MKRTAWKLVSLLPNRSVAPGVVLAALAGIACMALVQFMAGVSALIVAIVLGMLAGNLRVLPARALPGLAWASKTILRVGVVLLGLQLSLSSLMTLGVEGITILLVTVASTFVGTIFIGRLLGVSRVTRFLIATGFAICGASAVAAMSSVVDPEQKADEEVAQAVALVTLWGTVVLFALPLSQTFVALDDAQMGLWIGASVHEVAQVVAAGSAVSAAALAIATVAKLGRVVLLAPLVALVSAVEVRSTHARRVGPRPPIVPAFVLGFIAMVLVRSFVPLPEAVLDLASLVTTLMLTIAMFALGVAVNFVKMIRTGGRAALLGGAATTIAVGVSLTGIHLFGLV